MANIWDNHIQNNHSKSSKSIYQVGQIINTKIGPAKILDIVGPTFGPDWIYYTPSQDYVRTLTLMLLKNGKIFQTNISIEGLGNLNDNEPESA
jgi:hypothetical protein